MKTKTMKTLKSLVPDLREILSQLQALDERAADSGDNAWLREEISIMRGPGREHDRRRKLDEAAEKRERGWNEITRDYARLVGRPAEDVVVDRGRITRAINNISNLLREAGEQNI